MKLIPKPSCNYADQRPTGPVGRKGFVSDGRMEGEECDHSFGPSIMPGTFFVFVSSRKDLFLVPNSISSRARPREGFLQVSCFLGFSLPAESFALPLALARRDLIQLMPEERLSNAFPGASTPQQCH